jgi:hypothetical protein
MTEYELKQVIQLVKDTMPRPVEVTRTQAAQMLNKSRKTVQSMIDRGVLKLNENSMIPITEIDKLAYPKAA